ncbi:hypothetical protein BGZ80_006130 [Entomortierella chlamydospora]|uniref:Beta-lactamase/transpeptidase-like protein n=1 Tax=Entomortierella chlamydospora TaxID=101097 RepID=A0A9P6MHT7_9FUNG|nr:hypothetical protein BGZ79_001225 [Entomortierella chlamydospora]KAG0001740.1 hypothetical protein BGZ80_006130 [Entomortierella chlamydospora]
MQLPTPHQYNKPKEPLADLPDIIEKARVQCCVAGMSLAILHKGKLIFAEGFGKRDEENTFTAETLSPIGSLTKAFTATAIGEMVAEGKMDWDKTPVNKYLPEFELKDPVLTSQLTLADLLSHRTSLPRIVEQGWVRTEIARKDLIKRLKYVEMPSKLSSMTQYNNVMYAVAGEAAANIAGIPYEDVVREKVLKPLGLTNTGFSPTEMKKRTTAHAMPYNASSYEDAQKGIFQQESLEESYMTLAPAGDMYSNVLDLVRWGRVVMKNGELDGKQTLNKKSIQETLTARTILQPLRRVDRPELAPLIAYGLGWTIDSYKGHNFYWHNGGLPWFTADLIVYPDDDLVIAQLSNVQHFQLAKNLARYIADELLDLPRTKDWIFVEAVKETKSSYEDLAKEMAGDLPERILNKPATHPTQAYVGEYSNPVYGKIKICLGCDKSGEDGSLYFELWGCKDKLEHYHFDSFVARLDYWVDGVGLITFQTGGDGKVMSLTANFSLLDIQTEFKRKDDADEDI